MTNLYAWFPGLQGRDREDTKLEVKDSNITYSVWVSFAEIYNENIHDLLKKVPESKKKGEKVKRPTLKLSDDRKGQVYINGLREVQVSNADEAYQILMIGRENLHFAATRLNQQSSRSHCIFTVKLVRVADPTSPHLARVSMLSFCDLAGSERISKTQNVGERQKEAGNINTSLLVLGRCIKAIRHNQALKEKKGHQIVPFRESKLTRLFKSSFTGFGKSSLIICISQAQYLFDESIQVCKFASIASKVTVETKKEPPPKKIPKKSSRFSSMIDKGRNRLLSIGGNSILGGRGSIAWEAPPRKSILGKSIALPASFNPNARSTIVGGAPPRLSTLINISEMEEVGEGDETVPTIDNTVVQTQYESLMGLVENLKQKLIEERKKNQNLEKEIREELCEEFNNMLVEVESGWERRLQAEKEDAERMNDWRIGELQTVHRNRNKRRRGNDSGEFQSEIDAHRLKSQLETKEKEVVDLCAEIEDNKQQMEVMKETTVKSKQEQDRLQMANSKLKFELAEQQRVAAELEKKVANTKAQVEEETKKNMAGRSDENELLMAERKLASLREELITREEEVSDLKDLIQEAGDEFLGKEEELKDMQKVVQDMEDKTTQQGVVIQDLQAQLEESHELLQAVNNQLEESEQRVEDLEHEMEKMEKEDVNDIKETIVKLRKQVGELEGELRLVKEKCTAAEELSTEFKYNFEAAEKVAEEERDNAKDAEERMIEAQSERNKLLSEKSKLLEQLAEMKEGRGSQSQELEASIECFDLKQQVESLKTSSKELLESNDTIKKHNSDLEAEIESLRILNNELKSATSVDESLIDDDEVDQLKKEIKTLVKEKECFEEALKSNKEIIDNLNGELERLKENLGSKETGNLDKLMEKHDKEVAALNDEIDSRKKDLSSTKDLLKASKEQVNEAMVKVKDLEEQLEASEKLMEDLVEENDDEKKIIKSKLEQASSELVQLKKEIQDSKHTETNLLNSIEELKVSNQKVVEERDRIINEKQKLLSESVGKEKYDGILKEVDAESSKSTSLEKDLSNKTNYIKELEDIIVEKEFKISELEKADGQSNSANVSDKLKQVEETKIQLEQKLKVAQDQEKDLKVQVEELTVKAAENLEVMAHQEKMKRQRDDLEKRILELEKASKQLSQVEDELKDLKDAKRIDEESLVKYKAELEETKDELKVLKRAAKTGAKDAQEVIEVKAKNEELSKEVDRLNSVALVNSTEQGALGVLKSELDHKSKEIAQVQEKVEDLRSSLGSKNKEISLLTEKIEFLQSNIDSMEYDLGKTKDDRDKLMEHYDKVLKKKQEELDSIKALDREKGSLGEIMAKATPSKQTGELKRKLAQSEAEVDELKEKLTKEEDKSGELKSELINLQKQMETKIAQYEREVNRTKLANQKVIAEYRDTNKELQRKIEVTVTSPASPHDDTSPTLEADDSKTDASLIEGTPVSKKGKGRGRGKGKGRTNRSTASLASCEESNNENDPDVGRPRTASVSRKSRVTRKSNKEDNEINETDRSMSRKRTLSSRSEGNILREKQSFALSPVPEGEKSANSSTDFSVANTPALKKKRKLCSMTPQHSEVFTPPTDLEESTPGSVVKRQLRTRRQSKR